MPCLNEAETLATCIRKAQSYLDRSGVSGEIVIGDNGSTDGSQAIATSLGAGVVHVPIRGYGAALCGQSPRAKGRIALWETPTTVMTLKTSMALSRSFGRATIWSWATGSRAASREGHAVEEPLHRESHSVDYRKSSSFGRKWGISIAAFADSRRTPSAMDLRTTGMEFASEMVIKAKLMGLKIAEVPTTCVPMVAPVRRICAPTATAGGICASC